MQGGEKAVGGRSSKKRSDEVEHFPNVESNSSVYGDSRVLT